MNVASGITDDGRILAVRVPLTIRKRGGRKQVLAPEGAGWGGSLPRVDNTMVKALARAFRWRRLLEKGVHLSIRDLAAAEQINPSYVSRVLRLTLLAPVIVESVLDGRIDPKLSIGEVMKPFPVEWDRQLCLF